MFEKEADYIKAKRESKDKITKVISVWSGREETIHDVGFQQGAEFGYNKAKEEARLQLKDEGIVKPLKDSILRNERLSSQEQQELCAWIEFAMDFGENLDECAKELEEAKKANEWHYPSKGEYPKDEKKVLCILGDFENDNLEVGYYSQVEGDSKRWRFEDYDVTDDSEDSWGVSAWKKIVLPKESE